MRKIWWLLQNWNVLLKKKQKKQYEQITCSVSLFCNASFLKCLIVGKNAFMHPSHGEHTKTNKPSHTYSLHTHTHTFRSCWFLLSSPQLNFSLFLQDWGCIICCFITQRPPLHQRRANEKLLRMQMNFVWDCCGLACECGRVEVRALLHASVPARTGQRVCAKRWACVELIRRRTVWEQDLFI